MPITDSQPLELRPRQEGYFQDGSPMFTSDRYNADGVYINTTEDEQNTLEIPFLATAGKAASYMANAWGKGFSFPPSVAARGHMSVKIYNIETKESETVNSVSAVGSDVGSDGEVVYTVHISTRDYPDVYKSSQYKLKIL